MLKNIAIIMGGYSSEYQISLKSGGMVYDTLDRNKYTPYAIHIFKNKWVYVTENGQETPIKKEGFTATNNTTQRVFDLSKESAGYYDIIFIDISGKEVKYPIIIK